MSRRLFYPFYPERILWTGVSVLVGGVALGAAFLFFWFDESPYVQSAASARKKVAADEGKMLSFSFNLKEVPIAFPFPKVEPEMTFSFDPPRPDAKLDMGPDGRGRYTDLFIRFKQSAQSKRISLPARIDLQFSGGKLSFVESESPFWVELASLSEEKVQGVVWVETAAKERIEAEKFQSSPQPIPIQGAAEFPEGSPFRLLGEARWLGHDVFAEKYGGLQTLRVALGGQPNPQIFDLRDKEWMVWSDGQWLKGTLDEKRAAIARIESVDSKALILEGWDGERHVRLSFGSASPASFKMKGEEIFNSIRVRSEKQISCMMEKQCLILRSGDWVMKSNGRWKVLRKKEEREAFKSGKIGGELFAFEKIESKQGQKFITGFLFNAEKSQAIPIDLAANQHQVRREAKEK